MLTALLAGLLGSAHCFGMCGGIAATMAATSPGNKPALGRILGFNGGRVLSYVLLGAVAGWLAGGAGSLLQLQNWGLYLRLATAILIFLLGCHYLFGWRALDWIEKGGSFFFRRLSRFAGGNNAIRIGLLWGWLPCGLVYSLLLTAASTGQAISGGLVMLAFGLGTLPSMTGTMLAVPLLSHIRGSKPARQIIGFAMILFAIWTAVLPLQHAMGQGAHDGHVILLSDQDTHAGRLIG